MATPGMRRVRTTDGGYTAKTGGLAVRRWAGGFWVAAGLIRRWVGLLSLVAEFRLVIDADSRRRDPAAGGRDDAIQAARLIGTSCAGAVTVSDIVKDAHGCPHGPHTESA